jgi:hypothetical protein
MSCANSTPPVSSQKARSTPRASSSGKRWRPADRRQGVCRALGPVGAVAGQGERTGRRIKSDSEVAPQKIPGGEGGIDHARVAAALAVGMADQAMLIDRRGERIGQIALLEQLDPMTRAHQSPRGAEAHHAAADDDRFHGGGHSASRLVASSAARSLP